ncbi:MAG: hypothetical protein EZS28_012489 [Streblomastix strix]|uniref:Uncharacterized protein n=1 Tax=Streblomastix strix TaxID=222440 RepID=A0A5J4WBE7_9EUKA|nr:MAG: hypothetical protein EZS28_012489 [Streblomastix strix]
MKLFHSLSRLTSYKLSIHLNQEYDLQTFAVRHNSRLCLWYIHYYGDEQDQFELVRVGHACVLFTQIGTAGGYGEEQDKEINLGLFRISLFLNELHSGRNYSSSVPPQPLLAQSSEDQIEEEGGIEEVEAQLFNKRQQYGDKIKYCAGRAKASTLNNYIKWSSIRPRWV